jgi:hypothetical protein
MLGRRAPLVRTVVKKRLGRLPSPVRARRLTVAAHSAAASVTEHEVGLCGDSATIRRGTKDLQPLPPVEAPACRYQKYPMGNFSLPVEAPSRRFQKTPLVISKLPSSRRPPIDSRKSPWSFPSFPRRGALPSIPEKFPWSCPSFLRRGALPSITEKSLGHVPTSPVEAPFRRCQKYSMSNFPASPIEAPSCRSQKFPWSFPSFPRRGALPSMPEILHG